MSPGGSIFQGLHCHPPFCRGSSGTLLFPSGKDLRKASEQKLGHQDLVSPFFLLLGPLGTWKRPPGWVGYGEFPPLCCWASRASQKSGTRGHQELPTCRDLHPAMSLPSPLTRPKGSQTTLPRSHLHVPIFLTSQTHPAPSSSHSMCLPDGRKGIFGWHRKRAGNTSLELVSGEPPLWWEVNS